MPSIEIRMMLQTNNGQKHVNFFTMIKPTIFSEEVTKSIREEIEKVVDEHKETEAGYAIVYYKNEELFTVSFMKGKEGEIWKHQIMDETKDPMIH